VLPFDALDFEAVLNALVEHDFVRKYEIDGEVFGFIPTFLQHQVINQREAQSALPAPLNQDQSPPIGGDSLPESTVLAHEFQGHAREPHAQESERSCTHVQTRGEVEVEVEKEGKEKNKGGAGAPYMRVIPFWIPTPTWQAFVEMRKKIRKPLTDAAFDLIVGKLEKLKAQGEDTTKVLEASIANAWAGVFPVRKEYAAGGNGNRRPTNAVNSQRGTNFKANRTDLAEL